MPDQSISPPAPLQQITLTPDDLKDPSLNVLNNILQNLTQQINTVFGHAGAPPYLKAGANFGGQPVKNVGSPSDPGDVVTQSFGESNYGASAIAPQIQALGKSVMQSYRRLNDRIQRERYSSFLNDTQSTPPTANTATISQVVSGGSTDVTVSAGLHQYVDGSEVPFISRTDSLILPASFSISSLTRSGGIVTATLGSSFTGMVGDQIGVGGTSDASFQGVFIAIAPTSGTTVTYAQPGPNASTSGGTMTLIDVYYYTRSRGQTQLNLVMNPTADTWSARTAASIDGTTIIAVVLVNNGGADPVNSAAGATPPVSGASVPVIRRL
jgi:hypothetical protein